MERKSRYVERTPEVRQKERELTDKISRELINATEQTMVRNFDGQMVSLNVYLDSLRMLVSYRLAEYLHSVPDESKPAVLLKIREAFGVKIGIALISLMMDEILKEIGIPKNYSQSNDFSDLI